MTRLFLWFSLACCVLAVTGCYSTYDGISISDHDQFLSPSHAIGRPSTQAAEEPRATTETEPDSLSMGDPTRSYVKVATIHLDVPLLETARRQLQAWAKTNGGYIEALQNRSVVLRVPSAKFSETLTELKRIGTITEQDIRILDVTEQMRDTDMKLKNLITLRDRLQTLVGKTSTVKEILDVERELNRVQTEIDKITATQKALGKQVRYAKLTLQLRQQHPRAFGQTLTIAPWLKHLGLVELMN